MTVMKNISLNKILSKQEIAIDDLTYILKLLKSNLSLHQTLELLKNKNNEKIFNEITSKLDEGILIEKVIVDYLPKQIKDYMIPLLKNMTFISALELSLDFYFEHKNSENKLISKIAYPCILLFISISALYLFDLYGMDMIINLVKTFNNNVASFTIARTVFRIIIKALYYSVLIITLIAIYYMQDKRIVFLYLFINKHFPNSLINIYYSNEFISLLSICINKGYKTKHSLEILKNMKLKPVVCFLAYHLDEAMLEGDTLKQAIEKDYYDLSISRFIKIANYTNDFTNMLKNYLDLSKEKIEKTMKRLASTIQLVTYLFIGIIVIFIYRILLMPMQALSAI